MNKKAKTKKKRSKHYESKLKIYSTFDDAMKVLVSDKPAIQEPPKKA